MAFLSGEEWVAAVSGLGDAPGKQRCETPLSPAAGPVCVTGVTGFVALHLTKQLLEKGYTVVGTVRSEGNAVKMAPVRALQEEFGEKLRIVSGVDCLKAESFEAAVEGCTGVFHTASPFFTNPEDPFKDLVEPAKLGTEACLVAAKKAGCVKRVIVTSSMASVMNMKHGMDYTFTSKDWNESSCPDAEGKFPEPGAGSHAYRYSKAVAEKAVWDFTAAEDCPFDAACINPPMVIGKNFNKPATVEDLNTSSASILGILLGKQAPQPHAMGWVDARDVACAHIVAYEHAEAGGRRFICAPDEVPLWTELAVTLKELMPDCPVICDEPAAGVGVRMGMDNTPLKSLGMTFTPLKEALQAQCDSLAETGFLTKQ